MQQHTAWGPLVFLVLALATACAGSQQPRPVAEGRNMKNGDPVEVGVAQVEAVLHARVLSPEESLAVRLLGMVGPDGSWSLEEVRVEAMAGGVRLTPVVHHRSGDMVIQMLIPLDEKVMLHLEEGVQRLEVRGRDSTFVGSIRVGSGAQRQPPDTHMAFHVVISGLQSQEFILFDSFPGDGYVESIEYRETGSEGPGPWQTLPGCEREGPRLRGRLQVKPERGVLSVEARAVSGQGDVDPEPAFLKLPQEP